MRTPVYLRGDRRSPDHACHNVAISSWQSEFCSDKPKTAVKYGLPESLAILSEMGEVTEGMMDTKVRWFGFFWCFFFKKS